MGPPITRPVRTRIYTKSANHKTLTAPACKPHRYTLLLSEAALHPPGMNAIDVLEQLHLLLAISKGSKVALRLVRESDYPADLHGARVIYKLGGIRAVAVLPQPDTSIYLSKPTDVEHHDAILKAITQKALDKQQSRAAVAEAIEALAATHSGICGTDEAVLLAPSFAPFEGSPP